MHYYYIIRPNRCFNENYKYLYVIPNKIIRFEDPKSIAPNILKNGIPSAMNSEHISYTHTHTHTYTHTHTNTQTHTQHTPIQPQHYIQTLTLNSDMEWNP